MAIYRVKILLAIAALTILSGCSTIRADWDFDPSADFYRLASYGWISAEDADPGQATVYDTLSDSRIVEAIEDALFTKGYIKQPQGTPDFLIGYFTGVEGKLDLRATDRNYGYATQSAWAYRVWPPARSPMHTHAYDEGTLVIDIVDPRTNGLIWRGSAKAEIETSANPQQREQRIRESVNKIMAAFPPN
ncbi:DUF4136 domain-containing protein [Candidatus Omnitrophota bacterium]